MKITPIILTIILTALLALTACDSNPTPTAQPETEPTPQAQAQQEPTPEPTPQSPTDALQTQCDAGQATACAELADLYYNATGVPQDFDRSATLLLKACDLDNFEACYEAGRRYSSHEEVTNPDSKLAVKLFQKACTAEVLHSCQLLGLQYFHGNGVAQDETRGLQLIQSACDNGDQEACEIANEAPNHPALARHD